MNIMNTRAILCIAALSTSALATPPVPTSATPPATSTTLGSVAAPQLPSVVVEKSDLQPASRENVESSEIRQALSELQALEKGAGSTRQIKEKKAALKAAIESGIKKDRKGVLRLLLNIREEGGHQLILTDYVCLFVQSAPDLAIALLDQVREQDLDWVVGAIGDAWAKSDPKAAFAWAKQQTDSKVKDSILNGVIVSIASKDIKGALAYIQSLSPGDWEERMIPEAFRRAAYRDFQGALAVMQSLPQGRTKDLATKGISFHLSIAGDGDRDPQAAWDLVSGIGDTGIRTTAQTSDILTWWSKKYPDAAIQWMLSLPVGQTKDLALYRISQGMYYDKPQAAWYLASVIGDEGIRTAAKRFVAWEWFKRDRAAASKWLQSLPVGQSKDLALDSISYGLTMSERQAAFDMGSGIGDTGLRTKAMVVAALAWAVHNPAAASQWMKSLPAGLTKDAAASGISWSMAGIDPQAAMNMAKGIADTGIRTEAQKKVVGIQRAAKAQLLPKTPLPRPKIVSPPHTPPPLHIQDQLDPAPSKAIS